VRDVAGAVAVDDDKTLTTATASETHATSSGTGQQRRVVKVHRVDATNLNE